MLTLALTLALGSDLRFDPAHFATRQGTVDGQPLDYRAYEGIVYVQHPVDVRYQTLNVYVPTHFTHGYTAKTAPIFFPNSVGGYMPGAAQTPGGGMDRMHNTLLRALAHGYVVVTPGARGRTLRANGTFTGKAPAAIVDLKAAVRYVRYNRGRIPGNTDRIVSNGTSAGGALSALLGATGNSPDYQPYLTSLGAANARDDIWAVSAYCPITNLDHADMAYEWLLNGVNTSKSFHAGGPPPGMPAGGPPPGAMPPGGQNPFGQPNSASGTMSATQVAQSAALKALFPAYVNGLHLRAPDGTRLTLNPSGTGPFRDYIQSLLAVSAQTAQSQGTDLRKTDWVTPAGTTVHVNWSRFVTTVGRMKQTAAFDSAALTTGENNLFGSAQVDSRHFTAFGMAHNTVSGASLAPAQVVKMMNPMDYLESRSATKAKFWRIRHGAIDRDTSVAIPTMLALRLQNLGYSVDFAVPWNTPHSGDYDLDALFAWIDSHAR